MKTTKTMKTGILTYLAHLAMFVLPALVILFALPGCSGGNANQRQADTKIVLEKEVPNPPELTEEGEESGMGGNYDDNPFDTVVAEYTPAQIRQLIGKAAPENVRDLFVLLPDEASFGLTPQERKQLMENDKYLPEDNSMQYLVDKTTTGENYIRLIGTFEGDWEVFAKKRWDDNWWIAVNIQFCGPSCSTHIAGSYSLQDNRLVHHGDANLAGYQDVWVGQFIDFDRITPQQQETAQKIWDENGYESVLFRLPTDGNTVTMYIDELPYLDEDIPSEVFREVTNVIWGF